MKKITFYILLSVFLYSCDKETKEIDLKIEESQRSKPGFNVTEVELRDTVILNYLAKYRADFNDELDQKGITVLKYVNFKNRSDYYISHIIPYESVVRKYPPFGYLSLGEQYVFIYSGLEDEIVINENSIDLLVNQLEDFVVKDQRSDGPFIPKNYDAPILKISIEHDTIFSELVGQNPY